MSQPPQFGIQRPAWIIWLPLVRPKALYKIIMTYLAIPLDEKQREQFSTARAGEAATAA
jgi:hypothetical protein